MIGWRIKNYTIKSRIGGGGMANVFLADEIRDDRVIREVAVKILHPALGNDEEYISRFESEARGAAGLNHPNIVTIHDFGSENGVYFIVMEYVQGRDLKDVLKLQPHLPQELVLILIEEITVGLQALHLKNLVHRDLKPANILISRDGHLKLGDLGLAKQFGGGATLGLTAPGLILGTAYYMSPEQCVGGRVDNRSDIFSLGVTAYEMISGVRPFQGETYSQIVESLTTHTPPALGRLVGHVSPQLEDLIARMMAKEPARRPQAVEEILDALRLCAMSLPDPTAHLFNRRDYLRELTKDPCGLARRMWAESVKRLVQRGEYFRTLGHERFQDAIQEFERALSIDPENSVAGQALTELREATREELAETRRKGAETARPEAMPAPAESRAEASQPEPVPPPAATLPEPSRREPVATAAETLRAASRPEPTAAPAATARAQPPSAPPRAPVRGLRRIIPLGILALLAVIATLFVLGRDRPGPAVSPATDRPTPTEQKPPPPEPAAPLLLFEARSEPAGAAVTWRKADGTGPRGGPLAAPCAVTLPEAGEWVVRFELAGHEPLERRVAQVPGQAPPALAVRLTPLAPPPEVVPAPTPPAETPPAVVTATLEFESAPAGARVTLLAAPRGAEPPARRFSTPRRLTGFAAGRWSFRIALAGHLSRDTTIVLRAEDDRALFVRLEPAPEPPPKPVATHGYIAVSVSVPATLYLNDQLFDRKLARTFLIRVAPNQPQKIEVKVPAGTGRIWSGLSVSAGDTISLRHNEN